MNKNIRKTVYEILEHNEYARENDNYLIVKVAEKLEPNLIKNNFENLSNSKLSLEGITRARRQFFKDYPHLKPKEMTRIREIEEQEYQLEYSNYNHIPRIG